MYVCTSNVFPNIDLMSLYTYIHMHRMWSEKAAVPFIATCYCMHHKLDPVYMLASSEPDTFRYGGSCLLHLWHNSTCWLGLNQTRSDMEGAVFLNDAHLSLVYMLAGSEVQCSEEKWLNLFRACPVNAHTRGHNYCTVTVTNACMHAPSGHQKPQVSRGQDLLWQSGTSWNAPTKSIHQLNIIPQKFRTMNM